MDELNQDSESYCLLLAVLRVMPDGFGGNKGKCSMGFHPSTHKLQAVLIRKAQTTWHFSSLLFSVSIKL